MPALGKAAVLALVALLAFNFHGCADCRRVWKTYEFARGDCQTPFSCAEATTFFKNCAEQLCECQCKDSRKLADCGDSWKESEIFGKSTTHTDYLKKWNDSPNSCGITDPCDKTAN